jgi:hypothetical protein
MPVPAHPTTTEFVVGQAAVSTPIAEGPASKYGKAGAALLALVAAVTAVLHGDHSIETVMSGGGAVVILVTYMAGRYAQATALLRDARSPAAAPMQPIAVAAPLLDDEVDELAHDDEPPDAPALPADEGKVPPDVGDQAAHDDPTVPSA